jgi:hypothetical protein
MLYKNNHKIVLYNIQIFCVDLEFKMAATTGKI